VFNNFFLKIVPFFFFDNVEKQVRSGQATDYNIIRRRKYAIYMFAKARTQLQTHTIFYTYRFPTAAVFTRTRLNVTMHTHCMSRYLILSFLAHPVSIEKHLLASSRPPVRLFAYTSAASTGRIYTIFDIDDFYE
jgi:hypothetical protein